MKCKRWKIKRHNKYFFFYSELCSPINWLCQTRRNLTIVFLNLNFAGRRKLCKNSAFHEKSSHRCFHFMRKGFYFLAYSSFSFCKCIPLPSLSKTDTLQDSVLDLKISTRSVTVAICNWLRRKNVLAENKCIGSRKRPVNWLIQHRD